jgi:hypothetical protein
MAHPIYRVTAFEVIGPYRLVVRFGDGTQQDIDFRPVLHGLLFGRLNDLALFNRVAVDEDAGTLVWPNGADFDPAVLHDWPAVCDELATRAQAWSRQHQDHAAG